MARIASPLAYLVFFLISFHPLTAQTGYWVNQTSGSSFPTLNAIDMLDENFGIAVGESNIQAAHGGGYSGVLMTSNGGNNWLMIESMSPRFDPELPDYTIWRGVHIVDSRTAWIVGDSAMVYATRDGGNSWKQQIVDWDTLQYLSPPTLYDVHMISGTEGMIVGGDYLSAHQGNNEMHPAQVFITHSGGFNWANISPPSNMLKNNPGALRSVDYAAGQYFMGGEHGLLLNFQASGFQLVEPFASSTLFMMHWWNVDILSPTDYYFVGTNWGSNTPVAYRTILQGTRYANMVPNNINSGTTTINVVDFVNVDNGWIGTSQRYLAMTTDRGATWTNFNVGAFPPATPLHSLDMVNSTNGWACGGTAGSTDGYIIRFFGIPPKPDISTTDALLDFGSIECERIVEKEFFIRNSGTGDLEIALGDISFNTPGLTIVNPQDFPLRIRPKRSESILVRWTPERTFSGPLAAVMSINSNDPDHRPWLVDLRGMRHHGTLDHAPEYNLSMGTCLEDTLYADIPIYVTGNRNPTFISWQFVSGHNDFNILRPDPGTVIQDYEVFTVRFAPQDSAWRSGVYRLVHGNPSCPDTSLITFNGLGQQTRVAASVSTVDFGSICYGTEKDTTITLSNIGNTFAYLGVLEFISGDPVFSSPDYSVFLEQDSSKSYRLRFSPLKPGVFEGTYRLIAGTCPDTLLLTLKGEGLETELEFDPEGPVRFGPLFVFQEEIRNITISNPGNTPAHITDIEFSEQHAVLQFSVRPFLPLTLRPGEFTTIAVRFYPSQVGEYKTSVIVRWDAQCADTAAIDIEAICVANPEIDAPESADLGVQECPPALRDTIMIRNEGNGPLVFYSVSITGPDFAHFRVIQPEIDDTVHAKSSYPMIVEFDRPTEGRSHAIIRMTHNDRVASPTEIDVTAERTIAEFVVEGDAATEFFTRLFVPEDRSFIIRNTSSQPLTVTDIRVVRSASVFEAIPSRTLPLPLLPGEHISFDIRFTPNARGPFTGVIEVESDPCTYVHELTVVGSGDTDGLSTDRANIDYVLDPCEYTRSCQEIILKNQSPEPVEVLSLSITQSGSTFAFDPPVIAVPFVLASNEERTLRLCASPTLSGTEQATLVITSNDPAYPVLNVALHASRDSSGISVSESDIDFGRLADCMPGEARRITVTNTGTLPETIEFSFVNGGAAFSATMTNPQIINPGQSYSFDVEFTRPAYGVFDDILLLTTERCREEFRISLTAEAVEQQYAANPDPLLFPTLNVGAVSNRQITVENNGGYDAHIARVEIQPAGVFSLTGTMPSDISAGNSADIGLRFAPAVEGDFTATVCIIFSSPCPDTICVEVEGRAVQGTIEAHPPLLVFGDKAQCEITTLFDTLRNVGTGPITLISAVITGPQASAFTNMTPLTPPEILQPGMERIFELRYDPAQLPADGPVNAALSVQTDDAVLPQFDIPLEAGRITLRADAGGTVDFGPVQIGSPESRTVIIRNEGSTPLCYVDASFPPALSVMPLPPFCIDPGEDLEVTLTLTLPTAGMFTDAMTLRVTDPCADSTVFTLQARGEEGALTQPASVDLGVEAWCTPSVAQFSITSTYLEEVTLESVHLEGPDAAFFSIVLPASTSLPLQIAPGATLPVEVSLTAEEMTRNYSATVVSSFTAFGSAIERRTTLTARRVLPALALEWLTFPATVVGQSGGTQSLSIVNSSEIPVSVQSLTLPGTHFILRNVTPPTPHVIPPSGSMTAEVEFIPQAVGNLVDSLILTSDHPCAFRVTARVEGLGLAQPIVQAVLSLGSIQATQDAIIDIPILTDSDLGPADVSGWSGGISFNRSMLWPLEVVTEGSLSANMQVDFTYDNANGEVSIIADGGMVASGVHPLAWLRCRVLIGNSLSTPLRMSDDFGFTGGYATVVDRIDGTFELVDYCMPDDRLLNVDGALSLRQNSPNPVSLSRDGTTSISYTLPDDSDITLDLYDVIGRHIRRADQGTRLKGTHTLLLDVSGLRQGTYMYVLHTQAGAVVKRMVIIP